MTGKRGEGQDAWLTLNEVTDDDGETGDSGLYGV